MGSAYVDVEVIQSSVAHSTAFLSYAWGYVLEQVAEALVPWASGIGSTHEVFIWMDCFTLNQHRIASGPVATPEELREVFGGRVTGIGSMVVMLDHWDNPGYVKRAWCLFELYTAIMYRNEVHIDIVLSPTQAKAFRGRINADGPDARAIDEALAQVKSEEAQATMPADLDAIQALIKETSGGNQAINDTVKQHLRRWFVSQGGTKVVAHRKTPHDDVRRGGSGGVHLSSGNNSRGGSSANHRHIREGMVDVAVATKTESAANRDDTRDASATSGNVAGVAGVTKEKKLGKRRRAQSIPRSGFQETAREYSPVNWIWPSKQP